MIYLITMKNSERKFSFSKIEKILDELKVLFEKRGYQINWKDLENKMFIKLICFINGITFFNS